MSMIQVMSHSGGGLPTDRTPFYGIKLPPEVKRLVQLTKVIDHSTMKKILEVVLQYIESGSGEEEQLAGLQSEKCTQETVRSIFSGIYTILSAALRQSSLKQEIFKDDLQQIKMPAELITDLAKALSKSRRAKLERNLVERRVRLPQLEALRWRVDVTISNSSVQRVLEPCVLLEMTLSDGSIKTFEVPVNKFHELRYNVSYVLKEMEDLEKRNILKLQD